STAPDTNTSAPANPVTARADNTVAYPCPATAVAASDSVHSTIPARNTARGPQRRSAPGVASAPARYPTPLATASVAAVPNDQPRLPAIAGSTRPYANRPSPIAVALPSA